MENVHLATSDDDLYTGYNEFHPSLDTRALQFDEEFQQAVRTSYGRRPPVTAKVPGTSRASTGYQGRTAMPTASGRPVTTLQDGLARPMTAVRGAGYTSSGSRGVGGVFDPLNQARTVTSPLNVRDETSPEEKVRELEKKVTQMMEESCMAADRGELKLALDKAKEAAAKERSLTRQREQLAVEVSPNMDLTFSVLFNLALQYTANDMFVEAMNTYQVIVKNRAFTNAGRLKVNMGNLSFRQGNYPKAIKFYRMALDQVPNTQKDARIKIMKNIGLAFVKMGQFTDALTSFEYIMSEKADFRSALHLITCHYALGDREKMKRSFLKILDIALEHCDDEEKYAVTTEDPHSNLILEAIKNDSLRKIERHRKQEAEWCILTAAKLIAPVIANNFSDGYTWCVDQIKASPYVDLSNDLEINKAVQHLRKREFSQAIEALKMFEKQDSKVASTAATNLSFLYYLQNEMSNADKYADQAISSDRYNAGALVNKGNVCLTQGDLEKAREFYQEALVNEAGCVEALYNLGLTYKKLGNYEEALDCFYKLHAIVRNYPHVVHQIANLYELLQDHDQAMEWYQQLATLVPTDPHLLIKIAEMWENEGDKQQAFQYNSDSYRYFPSNIEIIEWLGAYYIDSQVFEKANTYFERAAIIQPNQVKWQLMVASCHRRSGNYQQALQTYKTIHRKFPDNIECLKFLVRLCSDLGLKEAAEYATKLKKAEKAKELKEQRANSGSRPGSRRSSGGSRASREGSANSNNSSGGIPTSALATSPRAGGSASLLTPTPTPRSTLSGGQNRLTVPDISEPYQPKQKEVDASYEDPLGPQLERPKTSARKRSQVEDDFDNEDIGDDLLPE